MNPTFKIETYIPVKFKKLHPDAQVPVYATPGSACFDIFSVESKNVYPGKSEIFETGIALEVPRNHVLLIFSRSGHGFKHDVRLANTTGIIDSDFRGELKIKLKSDGKMVLCIDSGDRIAQGIIIPYPKVYFEEVKELSETDRGTGGFGSTGK